MTNLLLTILFSTNILIKTIPVADISNVSETTYQTTRITLSDNRVEGCSYWRGRCLVYNCNHEYPKSATEETETTEVIETKILRFKWDNVTEEIKHQMVISSKSKTKKIDIP